MKFAIKDENGVEIILSFEEYKKVKKIYDSIYKNRKPFDGVEGYVSIPDRVGYMRDAVTRFVEESSGH